jgi:hypothetical protein
MGTTVPPLFFFHPLFGSQFSPGRDGTQYHLLSLRKGKIIDMDAGKIMALMASLDPFLHDAVLDGTYPAIGEYGVRQTALALELIDAYTIHTSQLLLELQVVIPVCDVHSADTAI